ncbi:hypothetical protein VTJ83DRAFT_4130 [Remersonia thermophila]|uniref:Amidase n=1 Tax=Remersonia thermophila TaxID=72144 RepID=A0ABR4D939_9PEZI
MSRNIRQKYPSKPARAPRRQRRDSDSDSSLSLDLSDDAGYSGVDDVTDSDDDDDEHVVAAEEEHLISDALRKRSSAPPRPLDDEDDDADEESEADDDDDDDVQQDDDIGDDDADSGDDSASWEGFPSDSEDLIAGPLSGDLVDEVAIPVERHVRFAGVPDSDSDSTTTETSDVNDFFPDIFVEQSALDPSFRREIEDDDETSSNSSFWDFYSGSHDFKPHDVAEEEALADDMTPSATPRPSVPPADVLTPIASLSEPQELDGYETDGDTTEEDIPEPIVRKKQARRAHTVEPSSDSETERPTPRRPGKPRVGRFNLDRSDNKPIGVVDPATGKMIIFTPRRTNQLDLSPESLHVDFSAPDLTSPLVRNPGLVMMGAMVSSNTFGDFMNMQPFGPAEAFFPCTPDPFGLAEEESDDSYFGVDEEDEEESLLRIEDFVTFGDDSSDEESAGEWNDNMASSPTRPRTSASSTSAATESAGVHPLLSHFDSNSDVVGAFRRNQIHQQLIYSHKASQESLSFSAPYHLGTLRGIKKGRMESVTAPITPIRRHKRSSTITGLNAGPGAPQSSPLSSVSQKRKASGTHPDANAHKRHRSISDVEALKI